MSVAFFRFKVKIGSLLWLYVTIASAWAGDGVPVGWGKESGPVRALLVASRQATLSSEIHAKVLSLPQEGHTFKAGEDLVRFDCRLPQAQMASKEADLEASQRKSSSDRQLLKRGAIGQLEAALSDSAEKKARAEREMARLMVGYCQIKAPFAGMVVLRHLHEHELAKQGDKLLDIIDNRDLEVEIVIPSAWLFWLKPGHPIQLHLDETDAEHLLKVARIIAAVDPVSQSARVIAHFDHLPGGLASGMSGSARFLPPSVSSSP
ncbi:MAG: HlyD family efflux transporter periplasmic adaptor subunit [Magnetococcus sp. THC-1_WYH]